MTETEFRFKHSELIEYYQLIEMRLRGICADLCVDKARDWFDRYNDYESDSFGLLIRKTKEIQAQKQINLLSQDDFVELECLRKTRNYWAHECFGGSIPIVFNREGELKRSIYAEKIASDLNDAIRWDEKLTKFINSLKGDVTFPLAKQFQSQDF